jgi:hypothetical protein
MMFHPATYAQVNVRTKHVRREYSDGSVYEYDKDEEDDDEEEQRDDDSKLDDDEIDPLNPRDVNLRGAAAYSEYHRLVEIEAGEFKSKYAYRRAYDAVSTSHPQLAAEAERYEQTIVRPPTLVASPPVIERTSTVSAQKLFEAKLAETMAANPTWSRQKAASFVFRKNPGLQVKMLAEANPKP